MGSVTPGSPRPFPRPCPHQCHPPQPCRPPNQLRNHPRCHLCHQNHPRHLLTRHPGSLLAGHPRNHPASPPLNQAVSLPFPPSQAYSRPNPHPQVQVPLRPPLRPPLTPPFLFLNSWVNDLQTIDARVCENTYGEFEHVKTETDELLCEKKCINVVNKTIYTITL